MTLNYEITQEDLFRYQRYVLRASPGARVTRNRHVAFWSVLFFALATAALLTFQTAAAALVGYGLAAVCAFATRRNYDDRIIRALRAHAADPQLMGCLGQAQLTLSDSGMREVTQAADATIKWPGVIDAVRDGDYVFVRLTTGQAAVIARRSYSGPVPFDDIPRVISEFKQQHIAEPTAAPNGGPREPSGNSGAGGGLPSVS